MEESESNTRSPNTKNYSMSAIPFLKMHGIGNDFVIIDNRKTEHIVDIVKIANRRIGVGCDQVIIIEKAKINADCLMRIYNADGSEAGACGNATRCVAQIIMQENNKQSVTISVQEKILKCWQAGKNSVKVDMGKPSFDWEKIPLSHHRDTMNLPISYGSLISPVAVNIGNPHVIFFVQDINSIDLADCGPKIENNSLFPQKVNVNIAQIENQKILLKVWERGTGETLACGSGACATLVAAVQRKYISGNSSTISLPGMGLQLCVNSQLLGIFSKQT